MTSMRLSVLAATVLVLALPAAAERQSPPPGGTPKPFRLPETKVFTLENGLSATLVPYGTLPKVTVSVRVRCGNLNEDAEQVWLADLTGDMLSEGTTVRGAEDLAAAFAEMGGELSVNTGLDVTSVSTDVLAEFGTGAVRLLAEVVQQPALPESELERLKADRIRDLSIAMSQPQPLADQRFLGLLYGDHPYGRPYPTEEMLRGYGVDDVRGFYSANFGARRAHVYVVGVFDEQAAEEAIRAAFAGWEPGPEPLIRVPEMKSGLAVHLIDRPGAPQSTLRIGLPVVDPSNPDYTALSVTNTVLGGFFSSRITTNIREDKGYTYSPISIVATRYRAAHWEQDADVATAVTGAALKEIFHEIERLREEPPSADELDRVKSYMAGVFVLRNSSRGGIVNQLGFVDLHGLSDDYLTGYVQRVYAVTPEDVQAMARKYLRDGEMTIVVVGDRAQVAPQVAEFGDLLE